MVVLIRCEAWSLSTPLGRSYYYCAHFTDEETEAQIDLPETKLRPSQTEAGKQEGSTAGGATLSPGLVQSHVQSG